MPGLVILRVKDPGPEATRLLRELERELGVGAQPQTAGYVPITLDQLDETTARQRVTEVLQEASPDWRDHLELRS